MKKKIIVLLVLSVVVVMAFAVSAQMFTGIPIPGISGEPIWQNLQGKQLFNHTHTIDHVHEVNATGADNDWIISGNNMVSGVSGNVGIGGTNSLSKLYVKSILGFPNGAIRVEHSGTNGMGIFINPIGNTGPSLWANGRGRFDALVVGSVAGDNVAFNPGSGNLIVANYTQLSLTSGVPPTTDCDENSEMGRMKVDDSGGGFLYVCTQTSSGISWVTK